MRNTPSSDQRVGNDDVGAPSAYYLPPPPRFHLSTLHLSSTSRLLATATASSHLPQVSTDKDLANVAVVSAGGNTDIGNLISEAMAKVCGWLVGGWWLVRFGAGLEVWVGFHGLAGLHTHTQSAVLSLVIAITHTHTHTHAHKPMQPLKPPPPRSAAPAW